jgi:hypothetical protein
VFVLLIMRRSTIVPLSEWFLKAEQHAMKIDSLLYPPGVTLKHRMHSAKSHPIFNFLWRYYRFTASSLTRYSRGMGVILQDADESAHGSIILSNSMTSFDNIGCSYDVNQIEGLPPFAQFGKKRLTRNRDILLERKPFFGCFGLHEWAMLFSGNKNTAKSPVNDALISDSITQNKSELQSDTKQQEEEALSLRLPQSTIDSVVNATPLRCTHYDAWRFFRPEAKDMNVIAPLT